MASILRAVTHGRAACMSAGSESRQRRRRPGEIRARGAIQTAGGPATKTLVHSLNTIQLVDDHIMMSFYTNEHFSRKFRKHSRTADPLPRSAYATGTEQAPASLSVAAAPRPPTPPSHECTATPRHAHVTSREAVTLAMTSLCDVKYRAAGTHVT